MNSYFFLWSDRQVVRHGSAKPLPWVRFPLRPQNRHKDCNPVARERQDDYLDFKNKRYTIGANNQCLIIFTKSSQKGL